MSFQDIPLTKNCDVIKVMGKGIIFPSVRRAESIEENPIYNWQPFQIRGQRVVPCMVRTAFTDPVMPKIHGVDMDQPGVIIDWIGDVYLNVKMTLDGDQFEVDPSETPNISNAPESGGSLLSVTYNWPSTTSFTATQPWASWKLGSTGAPADSVLRYFGGYDKQWDDAEDTGVPIYSRSGGEWGSVFIDVNTFYGDRDLSDWMGGAINEAPLGTFASYGPAYSFGGLAGLGQGYLSIFAEVKAIPP